jgi:mono/diheme cytochrome c family protein
MANGAERARSSGGYVNASQALLAAAAALAVSPGLGKAQEVGHAGAGFVLAQRLCSECHAVRRNELQSPNENSPSFQTIALVPGMTAVALAAALNSSHRTMPNIILKADEQADIIAYILNLK